MKAKLSVAAVRGLRAAARLVGPLALLVGCQEEGPFLQTEEFLTQGDAAERYMGGACMTASEGNGMGGGTAPGAQGSAGESTAALGYQYGYEGRDGGIRFTFTDNTGEVLAERDYDEAFLNAGRSDEVAVEFAGQTWRFVNRGVQECQPIRDPDGD
jgi:hypothetical protein